MASVLPILKFTGILIEVLLIFNLLIFVHELGHFLAAKWRGLYVEEFALWFGKPLWRKKIRGVWYAINSIPAGGYVKLPQMAPMEAMEGRSEELPAEAHRPISALDKIIVAFAGPLFSFLLACVFAIIVWQLGRPMPEMESTTTIGFVQPDSPAEKAGIKPGDRILEIDGQKVNRFGGQSDDSITWRVVRSEGETVKLLIDRAGTTQTVEAKPRIPETKAWQRKGTRSIGIGPATTPVILKVEPGSAFAKAGLQPKDIITHINGNPLMNPEGIWEYAEMNRADSYTLTVERPGAGSLELPFTPGPLFIAKALKDSPAEKAGIKEGDRLVSVNGQKFASPSGVTRFIRANADKELAFVVNRNGTDQPPIPVKPVIEADEKRPMVGVVFDIAAGVQFNDFGRGQTRYPTVSEQIRLSVMSIVNTIDAIVSKKSDIGVQHMGGPIMMMNIYYRLFEQPEGWKLALWFSVLLNVNLALLNMLPLPVLDGGHIVLAIVEGIRRKPVNIRVLEWVQTACALLIIGFMLFVTFFDVQDVFGGGQKERTKFRHAQPAAESK